MRLADAVENLLRAMREVPLGEQLVDQTALVQMHYGAARGYAQGIAQQVLFNIGDEQRAADERGKLPDTTSSSFSSARVARTWLDVQTPAERRAEWTRRHG